MKHAGPHKLPMCVALFIALFLTHPLQSQNHGIYKKLYHHIYISHTSSIDFLKNPSSHRVALKSLQNFYNDDKARMRTRAFALARFIYNHSEKEKIKIQVINDHLTACVNDRSRHLKYQLSNHLMHFDKAYFDEYSIQMLDSLIKNDPFRKKYIVIAGYKDLKQVLPKVNTTNYDDLLENWDIVQALARIGDIEAIESCRKIIEDHPLDIEFFDHFLPGLIFTNDRQILDDLIDEILDNDVSLIGQRLKDYQRYYMLKHLLPIINEYPYHFVDESQLTEEEFYYQLHFAVRWLENNREQYTLSDFDNSYRSKPNPTLYSELSLFDFD